MKSTLVLALLALTGCSAVSYDAAPVSNFEREREFERDRPMRLALLLGQRSLDEDDYEPVEDQATIGLELVHEARHSVVGFEIGVAGSATEEEVDFLGSEVDVEGTTGEIWAGIRKSLALGQVRPYVGAGVAYVQAEVDVEDFGSSDDSSVAGYAHLGVLFDLSPGFFIGFDLRSLFGSDLDFDGFESDADYLQFALSIGGAF